MLLKDIIKQINKLEFNTSKLDITFIKNTCILRKRETDNTYYAIISETALHKQLHIITTNKNNKEEILTFHIENIRKEDTFAIDILRNYITIGYGKVLDFIKNRNDITFEGVYLEYDYDSNIGIIIFVNGNKNAMIKTKNILSEVEEKIIIKEGIFSNFFVRLDNIKEYEKEEIDNMIRII